MPGSPSRVTSCGSSSSRRPLHRRRQRVELRAPPHERGLHRLVALDAAGARQAAQGRRHHGVAPPGEPDRHELLERPALPEGEPRGLVRHHRAGLGELLEPPGGSDHVARQAPVGGRRHAPRRDRSPGRPGATSRRSAAAATRLRAQRAARSASRPVETGTPNAQSAPSAPRRSTRPPWRATSPRTSACSDCTVGVHVLRILPLGAPRSDQVGREQGHHPPRVRRHGRRRFRHRRGDAHGQGRVVTQDGLSSSRAPATGRARAPRPAPSGRGWNAASASAWRPPAYRARISWPQARSRSGFPRPPPRARPPARRAARGRGARRPAPRGRRAQLHQRARSASAQRSPARSASGSPRHSASAASSTPPPPDGSRDLAARPAPAPLEGSTSRSRRRARGRTRRDGHERSVPTSARAGTRTTATS